LELSGLGILNVTFRDAFPKFQSFPLKRLKRKLRSKAILRSGELVDGKQLKTQTLPATAQLILSWDGRVETTKSSLGSD